MSRSTILSTAALAAALAVGCEQASLTAPQAAGAAAAAAVPALSRALPTIDGTWNWSEEVNHLLHRDFALAIGVTPEGEVTHATCFNSGTITFDQRGSTFEGTATQPNGTCRTRGGQDIPNIFPEPFPLFEGRITGRSIHFGFSSPECPYQGVLTLNGDRAVSARGQGKCSAPRLVFHSRWQAYR
ncbi:MAG: hypothetical protein H0V43_13235 [Gemmatimonadales bacterium]|nr:hypothetical protein [Gemmatimonadales bacterium]